MRSEGQQRVSFPMFPMFPTFPPRSPPGLDSLPRKHKISVCLFGSPDPLCTQRLCDDQLMADRAKILKYGIDILAPEHSSETRGLRCEVVQVIRERVCAEVEDRGRSPSRRVAEADLGRMPAERTAAEGDLGRSPTERTPSRRVAEGDLGRSPAERSPSRRVAEADLGRTPTERTAAEVDLGRTPTERTPSRRVAEADLGRTPAEDDACQQSRLTECAAKGKCKNASRPAGKRYGIRTRRVRSPSQAAKQMKITDYNWRKVKPISAHCRGRMEEDQKKRNTEN